jgi:hypothetical protein
MRADKTGGAGDDDSQVPSREISYLKPRLQLHLAARMDKYHSKFHLERKPDIEPFAQSGAHLYRLYAWRNSTLSSRIYMAR